MKRPAKEDVEAHHAWVTGVAARLHGAWNRHPLLVLWAMRWFIHSEHSKSVKITEAIFANVPGFDVHVIDTIHHWYSPIAALKPLFFRLSRAWRGAYGCTCMDSSTCTCDCVPRDPSVRRAAQWIRENPERA